MKKKYLLLIIILVSFLLLLCIFIYNNWKNEKKTIVNNYLINVIIPNEIKDNTKEIIFYCYGSGVIITDEAKINEIFNVFNSLTLYDYTGDVDVDGGSTLEIITLKNEILRINLRSDAISTNDNIYSIYKDVIPEIKTIFKIE